MTGKTPRKLKPQPWLIYTIVYLVLRPFLFLRYGYRRPKTLPVRRDKTPITVLGNHASTLDFMFCVVAFYPKRLNFLVSSHFFGQKPLCYVLRLVQCIPKDQFTADVAAIRDMRSIVSEGGSVMLYPEGEVNGTGRTADFHASTARLCKLLRAPIYTVRIRGSYLTRPKWGPAPRRGRVETDIARAATAEEVRTLSNGELNARIREGIYQDDYAWQETARVRFRGKDAAEGLARLLYRCPRCGEEFTTRSAGNAISCTACGNRGVMDAYGFLAPAGAEDVIPASPLAWVELQREALREAIADPAYRLSAPCHLQYHLTERKLRHVDVGEGVVALGRDGMSYEGTAEGREVSLHFPLAGLYKLPFSPGLHFEIPSAERTTGIRTAEPQAVWKFVLALPLFREAAGLTDN